MKITYGWLKEYIDIPWGWRELADRLTMAGLALEGAEAPGEGLSGIVVGHVLERARHPNADRLSVCRVDVGDGVVRQIVCGAPNVAAGQKVPVVLPGGRLPDGRAIGEATLQRWVRRQRDTGALDPLAKAGGWTSPVDVRLLQTLVQARPDRTTDELTRAYNAQAARTARVHRSSILRALQRTGCILKKNDLGRRSTIGRAATPSAPRSARGSAR